MEFEQAVMHAINGIHVYETPTGNRYPSVTTILNATTKKDLNIEEWRKRENLSKEEADDLYRRSGIVGTARS